MWRIIRKLVRKVNAAMPKLFLEQIIFLKETHNLNEYDPILACKVRDEKYDENYPK